MLEIFIQGLRGVRICRNNTNKYNDQEPTRFLVPHCTPDLKKPQYCLSVLLQQGLLTMRSSMTEYGERVQRTKILPDFSFSDPVG